MVLIGGGLRAQELSRPDEVGASMADTLQQRNMARVLFDRNLNTYNWVGTVALDTTTGGTSVHLLQNYISNIIRTDEASGSRRKLVSNQENLALTLSERLSEKSRLQLQWSSLVYSDDRNVGLSNASDHSVLAGVEARPLPFLSFTPLIGYRWDNQSDVRDRGMSYTLAGRLRDVEMDGYHLAGSGQIHEDFLDPRLLADHFARLGAQKWFSGRTRDSIELSFSHLRRDFYAVADSNIETRIDRLLTFTNLLAYEVDRRLLTTVFVTVSGRNLEKDLRRSVPTPSAVPQFDTKIDEFRIETYLQAEYRSGDGMTSGQMRLGYSERDEAHTATAPGEMNQAVTVLYNERNRQEQTKDNLSRRTSLTGSFSFPLSRSDRLTIAGGAGILRYDTPSSLNVEDRDELLVAGSITTSHRISPVLGLDFTLEGNLSHVVYLLKERSANNNINRVLRFSPRAILHPAEFLTTANTFEVLANYTVYDFEKQVALVKSFSYRQFAWLDSTAVLLTDRSSLHVSSYVKLYERGQLKWTEFKEQTENTFADQSYAAQLRFSPARGTLFGVGVQYFSQSRYNYQQSERRLASFQRSFGPTCLIQHEVGRSGRVDIRGWYEHRLQPDGTARNYASMTINILLNF